MKSPLRFVRIFSMGFILAGLMPLAATRTFGQLYKTVRYTKAAQAATDTAVDAAHCWPSILRSILCSRWFGMEKYKYLGNTEWKSRRCGETGSTGENPAGLCNDEFSGFDR